MAEGRAAGVKRRRQRKSRTRTAPPTAAEAPTARGEQHEDGASAVRDDVDGRGGGGGDGGGSGGGPVDAASNDVTNDADDDGVQGARPSPDGKVQGRKRKRRRKGARDAAPEVGGAAAAEDAPPPSSLANGAHAVASPDPSQDKALSPAARAALEYAHLFVTDRASWKFQKARQTWLVRHALSAPPPAPSVVAPPDGATQVESSTAAAADAVGADVDEREGDAAGAEPSKARAAGWPDDYDGLVGAYLGTMQGASRGRLVETLRAAAASTAGDPGAGDEVSGTTTNNVGEAPGAGAWRRERARRLLRAMGEAERA